LNKFEHPLFERTKALVDQALEGRNFGYADIRFLWPETTWLEAMKTLIAYSLCKNRKTNLTLEKVSASLDPAGLQSALSWAHEMFFVQKKHTDEQYTGYSYFSGSFGLLKKTGLRLAPRYGITGGATTIFWNRESECFQEARPSCDPWKGEFSEMIGQAISMARSSMEHPDLAVEVGPVIQSEVDALQATVYAGHKRLPLLLTYHPLGVPYDRGEEVSRIQAAVSAFLRGLSRLGIVRDALEARIDDADLPADIRPDVVFQLNRSADEEFWVTVTLHGHRMSHSMTIEESRDYGGHFDLEEDPTSEDSSCDNILANLLREEGSFQSSLRIMKQRQKTMTRRAKAYDGEVQVEAVARHVIDMISKTDPSIAQQILECQVKQVRVDKRHLAGFLSGRELNSKGNPRAKESFSFSLSEGMITVKMHLADGVRWEKKRLYVGSMPDSVRSAIIGRDASEVADHPISKLLGKVKTAKPCPRTLGTWISFETRHSPIDQPN